MKPESYLAGFVKSHRSGLILTALVIEMLVSPAADYHPHVWPSAGGLRLARNRCHGELHGEPATRALGRAGAGRGVGLARLLEAFAGPGPSLFASGAISRAGALVLDLMRHLRTGGTRASRSTKPGDGARRVVYRLPGDCHRLRPTLLDVESSSYPAVQPGHPQAGHKYPAVLQHGDHQQRWLRIYRAGQIPMCVWWPHSRA